MIILLNIGSSVFADSQNKVVFHINEPYKLGLVVNGVKNVNKTFKGDVTVAVVVNGPAITRLAKISNTESDVKELLDMGASVGACSYALSNEKIDTNLLIEGVTVLKEGGSASIMKLQKEGYVYIKI